MTLTFGIRSIRDLFAKLQRDAALLDEEVTSDRLFNFVVTSYTMIDWAKKDPSVPEKAREAAQRLYEDQWLKVCRELANAVKHCKLKPPPKTTSSAPSKQGWNCGRWNRGPWGVGEEAITVTLNDGDSFSCLDLVKGSLATWQTFFSGNGIQ